MLTIRNGAQPMIELPSDLYIIPGSGTLEWTCYESADYEPVCYVDWRGQIWRAEDVLAASPSRPVPLAGAGVINYPSPGVGANLVGHDELIVHPIGRQLLAVRINGRCYSPDAVEWV